MVDEVRLSSRVGFSSLFSVFPHPLYFFFFFFHVKYIDALRPVSSLRGDQRRLIEVVDDRRGLRNDYENNQGLRKPRTRFAADDDDRRLTGDSTEQKKFDPYGYNCTEGGEDNITDTGASEGVNQTDFWFTPCPGRSGTSGKPAIRVYIAIDLDDDEPYRYDRLGTAEHPLVFFLVALHTLKHTQSNQTLLDTITHNVKFIKAIVYASFRGSRASAC
jgi:hypothetical protein